MTAGFGQDAFFMAWAGAQVTATERHPIVHALLTDGLRRAFLGPEAWPPLSLQLFHQDSLSFLNSSPWLGDVIYIDAMFEKVKTTAKSPKPMQLLQVLLSEDTENPEPLLEAARCRASRVVVKQPLKQVAWAKPTARFSGKSIRFDIYTGTP